MKIIEGSDLVKKTDYSAKINESNGKIPNINDSVKKTGYDAKYQILK